MNFLHSASMNATGYVSRHKLHGYVVGDTNLCAVSLIRDAKVPSELYTNINFTTQKGS